MRGRQPIVILAAAIAVAACGAGDGGETAEASEEPPAAAGLSAEEARVELIEADRAFARATADRGVDGWVEWFDPRGALIRGDGEITGHADVGMAMGALLSDSTMALRWTPSRAEVSDDATLGFTVGPFEVVALDPAPGDAAVLSNGMYLTVWARQADDSWKVLADIGSPAQ